MGLSGLALAELTELGAELTGLDRRLHTRLSASQVTWLKQVRLKYGPIVRLVDVSSGGMQIETLGHPLEPGSTLALELGRTADTVTVPAQVIRCHVAGLLPQTVYRGALAFKRPIDVPEDDSFDGLDTVPAYEPALTGAEVSDVPDGWHKLVVRYQDGRLLKGYGREFTASSGCLHVSPRPDAPAMMRVTIPVWHLKAVFFVRDFVGDPENVYAGASSGTARGRRMHITFLDGETLMGTTLNYNQDAPGFFVRPLAGGNNLRVFVVSRAIRHVQFL